MNINVILKKLISFVSALYCIFYNLINNVAKSKIKLKELINLIKGGTYVCYIKKKGMKL